MAESKKTEADKAEAKDERAAAKSERTEARTEAKAERKAEKQVQDVVDQETEQGFRGVEVDQTPNENYTVQGQLDGAEVPEAAADPVAARREASA